jgi:trigger factor
VVKLADTPDLGSDDASRGGSSPSARTIIKQLNSLKGKTEYLMQVTKIFSDNLKHKFNVIESAENLQNKFDKQIQKAGAKTHIKGFRPGKASKDVLVKQFGSETWEKIANSAIHEAVGEINKNNGFRNAIDPVIEVITFKEGKDFEFTLTFETLPDIDIKDVKSISVDQLNVIISDDDVKQRLNSLHKNHVRYQDITGTRPAKKGDLIKVKWSGVLEDGSRIEIPSTHEILLGAEQKDDSFKAVVKSLYGKIAGDDFEETIMFSPKEKEAKLAGKKATIKVNVQSIEEPVIFNLDNEFAKEFEMESLEDLTASVRRVLEQESNKIAQLFQKRKLLDALDAQYSFNLPPTVVENEFNAIWKQFKHEMVEARENGDMDSEDENKSEEDFRVEYQAIAERRVRLGLLVSFFADKNKIKLSDEEVRTAVVQEAVKYPKQTNEVINHFLKNKQALGTLVAPLLEAKVLDFILQQANVTMRDANFAELKEIVQGIIPTPY